MIKIAITADLHFRAKRLADIKKGWDELIGHLIDKKVDYLLIAGDIFEDFNIAGREASFGTIYHAFKSGLDRFIGQGGQVVFIPGNHDIAGPNDLDALTPLNGLPGIMVARSPGRIHLGDKIFIQCLPWLSDPKSYEDTVLIPTACEGGVNILLGHCEVEGTSIKDAYSLFGGHFELNKSAFTFKGYDCIALGHIHTRMDDYIGAPWHLSYSDVDNPTGFTMLTIENNEISSKEFIELFNSPRYHIYIDGIQEKTHRDIDYVRIKYHGNPPDVREFNAGDIELEKIPEQNTVQARVDIDHDASVKDLLTTWLQANNKTEEDIDVLMQCLDKEALRNYQLSVASGSLERVRSICMKHIGPHENTDITFNGERFIAISGHNGAGKSFTIDSLIAAPFGEFPSQSEVLMENVTLGYDGPAEVSQTFDSNGQTYRAQRILNKGKQKAFLYRLNNGRDEEMMAGPKVTDFEREIYKLLGDKKVVLSSVFSAQGDKGDIVSAKPTARKEILGQILGTSGLTAILDQAKKQVIIVSVGVEANIASIKEIDQGAHEQSISEKTRAIQTQKEKLLSLDKEQLSCRVKIKEAEEKGKECSTKKAKIEAAVETLKLLITEINTLQSKKKEAVEGITRKQTVIQEEPEIVKLLQGINNAKTEYEKHRDQVTENLKAKERRTSIEKDIQAQEAIISMEKERLLTDITILQEGGVATRERHTTKITRIDKDLDALREKQQLLLRAGCKDNPIPCVFIDDGLTAEREIQEKHTEQQELVAQLNTFTKKNSEGICGIETRIKNKQYATEASGTILRLQKNESEVVIVELGSEVEALKTIIDTEKQVLGSHQAIQTAKALLKELKAKEVELDVEIKEKLERQGKLEEETCGMAAITEEYTKLQNIWKQSGEQNNLIHEKQIEANNCIATLEGEIKRHKDRVDEKASLEVKLSTLKDDRNHYDIIVEAFGKNGIPQLLIASALPQIQDTLNMLLDELENKFYITFSTLGETKEGKTIETLDILVSDSRGERRIERFSGGEKKLLRSVIRIALGVFLSQRSGSKYQVFVVDEAFDALDKENAMKMLKILLTLKDKFNQIFVVSHKDELLIEFPARIDFKTVNNISCYDFITN